MNAEVAQSHANCKCLPRVRAPFVSFSLIHFLHPLNVPPNPALPKRLECLDGLRGLLAVYVMLSHMMPFAAAPAWLLQPLSHGLAAVDVFFILSGMVIVLSLDGLGYRAGPFLTARAFRIFPVFLVVFLFALAVQPLVIPYQAMPWIEPDSLARRLWADGWPSDWLGNITAHLTMTHGLFPDGTWPYVYLGFLGAAWSLSTEWQFYLLAVLAARPGREWHVAWGLLALAAAALAWNHLAPPGWLFSRAFLPNKAHFFALGIASAALMRGRPQRSLIAPFGAVLAVVLAICLTGGVGKTAAPLVWTLCLAAQMQASRLLRPLAVVLRCRTLLWLGAVSYCLYLVNEPVQKLLGLGLAFLAAGQPLLFSVLWLPLAALLPIGAAWWLHSAIEQPALRWGKRIVKTRISAIPALNSP
jgi:peptidoglycan/LPS O-acetylase OafA/YrhL